MDPFPPPALRTERTNFPYSALQWDNAPRTRNARSEQLPAMPVARGPGGNGARQVPEVTRLHPRCPSPTRHRACSRPDSTRPPFGSRSGPFAYASDASGLFTLSRGVLGIATPAGLRPSVIPPHLGPLSSAGITRRLRSYGPLRHPAGPACPSRGSGCRVHGTDRASRVATSPIFHVCRRHYPGGNGPVSLSLSTRSVGGLPLDTGGSAPTTQFSGPAQRSLHVPAHVVAEPPANSAPPLACVRRFRLRARLGYRISAAVRTSVLQSMSLPP